MKYFNQINVALATTENIERFLPSKSFEWSNKAKRDAVNIWINSLYNLSIKRIENPPYLEPLLFVLADKICLEKRGSLFKFLKYLVDDYSNIPNYSTFLVSLDKIKFTINRILEWETLSESFFKLSKRGLNSLSYRPSSSTFFCKIKEFHPRRLYIKHPWNEVQLSNIHSLSTKNILELINDEPLLGHRFFLGSESAPALGIGIMDGHHRIYELYSRFINYQLVFIETMSGSNGDIQVLVVEKW